MTLDIILFIVLVGVGVMLDFFFSIPLRTQTWVLSVAIFVLLIRALRGQRHPGGKEGIVKIMYIVKDDNPNVSYAIEVGEVKDSEGTVIADAQLSVEVASDNPAAVAITPGDSPKTGTLSFGSPGNATVIATVKDGAGNVLGTGSAAFLVTTGDPKSIAGVSLKFDGLTEAPAAPPA